MSDRAAIAVEPDTRPAMYDAFRAAVEVAGGRVVAPSEASALMWADPARADLYPDIIAAAPDVGWVQLPYAGVEPFLDHLDPALVWTCGKGVYAEPVAEHVLALALAGFRGVGHYSRQTTWAPPRGRNLFGAKVTVLGGGGITESLMRLLGPFGCEVTVVRRSATPFPGAALTVTPDRLHDVLATADLVVVALALTEETTGIIDRSALEVMSDHAWLVNVGRGAHIVTADLVAALEAGAIGGAALDVTEPEPLPDDSPLWHLENCLITPHIANTPEMGLPLIADRVEENVRRYLAGDELIGLVDVERGY